MISEKSRQELAEAIERGDYKIKGSSSNLAIVVSLFFIVFAMMLVPSIATVVAGRKGFILCYIVVFFLVFVGLGFFLNKIGGRAAYLGKLSARNKWLILYGDKIEAELDSIDQIGSKDYQVKCHADYHGRVLQFKSPVLGVRPIPFEEKKIDVFVNPQKPSQYLVNFYEHIPYVSKSNVLQDRSELKCEPRQTPNDASNIVVIVVTVICCMIASGSILMNGLFLIFDFLATETSGSRLSLAGGNLVGLIGVPALMFFIIYKVKTNTDNRKKVLAQGYYIEAVGDRTWTTSDDDGHTTYHLAARYIEPKTKIMHEFTDSSGSSWICKLVGIKIRVYLNPDNTKQYTMCSNDAEKNMGFTADKDDE